MEGRGVEGLAFERYQREIKSSSLKGRAWEDEGDFRTFPQPLLRGSKENERMRDTESIPLEKAMAEMRKQRFTSRIQTGKYDLISFEP